MFFKIPFAGHPKRYIVRFLGVTQLVADDARVDITDKRLALLLLLLFIKKTASRTYFAGKLWPDQERDRALASLRNHLSRNRELLAEIVDIDRSSLRLADHVETDIDFLLSEAPISMAVAIEAHRNQFLNGEDFSEFPELDMLVKRLMEDYKSKAISAIHQELKMLNAERKLPQATILARRMLLISPLSESAVRILIRLYKSNGDRAAAIDVYERFRSMLRTNYGIEPEQKTRQLHRDLFLQESFRAEGDVWNAPQVGDTVI